MGQLDGKLALVTGGGSGIGKSVCLQLANAGADILINDIKQSDLETVGKQVREIGRDATVFECDVSESREITNMFTYIKHTYGKLDILVNCAGVINEEKIENISDETWDKILKVNLYGTFYTCRAAVTLMKESNTAGSIINIASELGQIGCDQLTHYSAAKGGVIAFTKALAREVIPNGIRVNAVAPSGTDTPFLSGYSEEELVDQLKKYPIGRFADPNEIASSVLFLATENSSYFVGQILGPNGGVVMNG